MATKNIVPRATGEGKLGTSSKKWLEINTVTGSFELLKASGLQDESGNDLIVAGDNITVNKSASGQFEISGSGGGGLADLVSDTSPQLGGILDLNSFDITGSGNINITGNLTVDGSVTTLSTTNLVVEDPVILLASGSTSSNTNGGIAILSGSSVLNESLVFGRIANDTWGVGRKDVTGGTVTDLSDMTLVDFKAATISASIITASNGFSGSLTQLSDGSSYLIEGTGISIVSESNGAITISSSGGGGSSAADDITLGDAEVNIKTTSGNINLSGSLIVATGSLIPAEASSFDLGSTTKEWKDIYLSDNSKMYFGSDQDVYLSYSSISDPLLIGGNVDTLLLKMGSTNGLLEPTLRISGSSTQVGPRLALDNALQHINTYYIGSITFDSINTAGERPSYALLAGQIEDMTDGSEIGSLSLQVMSDGYRKEALAITGGDTNLKTFVDIIDHNGLTAGLKLAGTLVTATANELNLLDGSLDQSSPTSTIVDDDRFIINDNGIMTHVSASVLKSYIGGGTTYASQAADFTAESGYHYGVDTSSGIITADLPSVTGSINGSIRFKIKAGTNALVLEGAGSETIDGFSSFIITDLSQSLSVMSDGVSNWEIF